MFRFVYEHEHSNSSSSNNNNNNSNNADNNYNCNQLYDVDNDLQFFNANRSVARKRPQLWWRLAGYTHNKHTTVGRQQWCDDNAVSSWTRYLISGAVLEQRNRASCGYDALQFEAAVALYRSRLRRPIMQHRIPI